MIAETCAASRSLPAYSTACHWTPPCGPSSSPAISPLLILLFRLLPSPSTKPSTSSSLIVYLFMYFGCRLTRLIWFNTITMTTTLNAVSLHYHPNFLNLSQPILVLFSFIAILVRTESIRWVIRTRLLLTDCLSVLLFPPPYIKINI